MGLLGDDPVDALIYGSVPGAGEPQQLAQQPVLTPSGGVLPLSALADLVETVDSNVLRRIDGRRSVTLFVIPPRQFCCAICCWSRSSPTGAIRC